MKDKSFTRVLCLLRQTRAQISALPKTAQFPTKLKGMGFVMDIIGGSINIAIRSLVSVIVLFLLSKISGVRQIAQLTFYDYVVGISIGSISAVMAVDKDIPYYYCIIAMLIYVLFTVATAYVTSKSIFLRRFFTGKPSVMIYKGKIIRENMKKHHYDVNDLLLECRIKGYFNIDDIECAVMETNGEVSILPKSVKRSLNPEDMGISPVQEQLQYNLIIDGKVLERNLKAYGKDYQWLKTELKNQKVKGEKAVLLAVGDVNNGLIVYLKDDVLKNSDFFI